MTRVLRHATWTIGADREAPEPPARFVTCKGCEARSEPSTAQADTDAWALKHAGQTGHRTYREFAAAHLRAYPAPGNPHAQAGEGS
ncbi:hypothetical protein ACFU51_05060 [Streptomyces sp. NPDC057430]|uniref:DUF7848 domain-containing protein n=1 Tax=Streptomyces sp. NPDC057430 TaxID=3346131 RepID=UPI003688A2DB